MFKIAKDYEWCEVNKEGICRNSKTKRVYKPHVDKDGYLRISTKYQNKNVRLPVHRAVAIAFIDNPDKKPQVNHKDSNRQNNHVDNLEWVTAKENTIHGVKYGMIVEKAPRGEINGQNVYSEKTIRNICKDLENGLRNTDIIKKYNVERKLPSDIRNGKSWLHVSREYNIPKIGRGLLGESTVKWICHELSCGKTAKQILESYTGKTLKLSTINNIRKRVVYKNISKDFIW